MSVTPVIRAAEDTDRDTIVSFNCALALESEGKALDREVVTNGVEIALNDPERLVYRVAELEGSVVGCLALSREWSDWRSGWFLWIQSVYVSPDFRRQGVYRALHESVVEQARADSEVCGVRLYVEENNQGAQKTYLSMGMTGGYVVFDQPTGGQSPSS